ncbi:MAG TPA: hypothetical protein VFV13_11730 [Acidimicrobiia bacterium]|nr:hypothetical protein [Acidimicrobiia bacterium]
MIDSRELRRRAGDGRVVFVDADGSEIDGPLGDVTVPALLVVPVSEAVKRAEKDRLTEDIDRSLIWAVRGIAVDHAVVETLPDGSFTISELIDAVTAAGHVWRTTPL